MPIQKFLLLVGFACLCGFCVTTASASDTTIRFSAAELSTPVGAQKAYKQIVIMAKDVCDAQFDQPYAVKTKSRFERCLRRTVKEIVVRASHPELTQAMAIYSRRDEKRQALLVAKTVPE